MIFLTKRDILRQQAEIVAASGGTPGVRDPGGVDSAVAQPRMTFGGVDLYPTVADKAAALCFSLVKNHPFIDGNKRIGHAAMETFLVSNGFEIDAPVDEQEQTILALAAGQLDRATFTEWVRGHVVPMTPGPLAEGE